MEFKEKRRMALGVINYCERHASHKFNWIEAQKALDDFSVTHDDTVAANFWINASDYQIKLLRKDFFNQIIENNR